MINDRHHPILLVFLVLAPGLNLSWQRWDAHLSAQSQFLTCLSAECQKAPLIVESRIASSELGIISPSDNCVCKPQVPAFSQSSTGKVIKSASSPNQDTQCIDCLCHYISIQRLNSYFSNFSNTRTQGGLLTRNQGPEASSQQYSISRTAKIYFHFSKLRLLPNIDNPRSYDVFEGSIINPKEDVAACA